MTVVGVEPPNVQTLEIVADTATDEVVAFTRTGDSARAAAARAAPQRARRFCSFMSILLYGVRVTVRVSVYVPAGTFWADGIVNVNDEYVRTVLPFPAEPTAWLLLPSPL